MFLTLLKDYKYHNAPEGQKLAEKVIATTKYGFVVGSGFGVYECCMNPAVTTPLKTLNCLSFYVVPITAMCATFSIVTYAATNIREVDGPMNYALGAIAASSILHKWFKNPMLSLHSAVFGAIIAASYKHAEELGLEVFPMGPTLTENNGLSMFKEFTLMKDPRPWKN